MPGTLDNRVAFFAAREAAATTPDALIRVLGDRLAAAFRNAPPALAADAAEVVRAQLQSWIENLEQRGNVA
jgi:hypothetical protein